MECVQAVTWLTVWTIGKGRYVTLVPADGSVRLEHRICDIYYYINFTGCVPLSILAGRTPCKFGIKTES